MKKTTYVITGATGTVGGLVVERLLERGEQVRVLVRDRAKARRRFGDRVEIAVGDLANPASLPRALAGGDALLLINVGPELAARDAAAAQAARVAGIGFLVKLSSKDAAEEVGTGPWHAAGEAAIRAAGIPFTFLRPAGFMSNALGWATSIRADGVVGVPTGGGRIPFIHPDDLAEVATRVLVHRGHDGETLELTGPEALTYAEMTAAIGAAIGQRLGFRSISDAEARKRARTWGEPPAMVDAYLSIWRAIRDGRLAGVTTAVERVLGRKPIAFARWAEQHAGVFADLLPHASWTVAPSDLATPRSFANQTIRHIVRTSIGGEQARVRFSNRYGTTPLVIAGAHIALAKAGSGIDPGTDRALTVDGHASFTIAAGAEAWTDPVALAVPTNGGIAVSVFVRSEAIARSGRDASRQTSYIGEGDQLAAATITGAVETEAYHWITGVDVYRREPARVVVLFGDSNLAGFGAEIDANQRFHDHLSRRLAAESRPVGVVNAAIPGNRASLDGPVGEAATRRFARDVLGQSGASHVIVHLGINDIGLAGMIPAQCPSADDIIAALEELIAQARARDLKVILATLLPWKGATLFGAPYGDAAGEQKRLAVNAWIRGNRTVHGVLDLDAVVQDRSDPARLDPRVDAGDHLHCNATGYQAMAAAVDVSMFG
jgi:uncharacterized protein YbjT (DUF2867 family)/lysophospholipase L1-like esterase